MKSISTQFCRRTRPSCSTSTSRNVSPLVPLASYYILRTRTVAAASHPKLSHSTPPCVNADCGSCWAHGAISALGARIKIARKGQGVDVNLAVQHVLNCANVGSCHGGSVDGPYQWMRFQGG